MISNSKGSAQPKIKMTMMCIYIVLQREVMGLSFRRSFKMKINEGWHRSNKRNPHNVSFTLLTLRRKIHGKRFKDRENSSEY